MHPTSIWPATCPVKGHSSKRHVLSGSPRIGVEPHGRSGRLTFSAACQESLLIRRDGTPLPQGRRANQAALRPAISDPNHQIPIGIDPSYLVITTIFNTIK